MPKFPLEWHRESLRETEEHLKEREAELISAQIDIAVLRQDIVFMRCQIAAAEHRSISEYDPEQFMVEGDSNA